MRIHDTMKKRLFFLLPIACFVFLTAQSKAPNDGQIAYYKHTKVVSKDGRETAGDNTGQFIRFTDKSCYDSDKDGIGVGNGYLMYKGMVNGAYVYSGDSFLGGKDGNYYFNNDLSRLNIQTADGVTYKYEKATAPKGVVTCAKIYVKPPEPKPTQDNRITTAPVYPVTPPNTNTYTPPPPSNTNIYTPPPPLEKLQCSSCGGSGLCKYCRGSGRCPTCGGIGVYGGVRCPGCNGTLKCNYCYVSGNGKCYQCKGNGKY